MNIHADYEITFFDFDDIRMIETGHEIDLSSNSRQIVWILDARLLDGFNRHFFILTFI